MAGSRETTSPSLFLRGVSKDYVVNGQTLAVLRNVALDVEPGEFISIVGASGCGKSTMLRLIIGLDADYEGDILLDGRRVDGPSRDRGIVFQDHRLFPWLSVAQNVALALDPFDLSARDKQRRVEESIALVGLSPFATAYPRQLSGGMAQRAAIARALVRHPEILLLDEPLGALDSLTRAHLQDEIMRICEQQRMTVLMVTHDVEEAIYLGDRVVVMEPRPGRIRSIMTVDLPRPRKRGSREFAELRERILGDLIR